jgi:hypothetical protein
LLNLPVAINIHFREMKGRKVNRSYPEIAISGRGEGTWRG